MNGTYEKDAVIEWPVISVYTSKQAVADGILVDVGSLNPAWKDKPFSHITSNLLSRGYREADGSPRLVNIVDLLNQALRICQSKAADTFYAGSVELPDGSKTKVFIEQNETGKFTILLPEDY